MFIRLTRTNGQPIWLNASFIVTVEPARSGGAIVVPIGDGFDYEVRETPDTVLAMLDGAPAPTVVPVPPPKTLTPTPDDVSPDFLRKEDAVFAEPEEPEPDKAPAPQKRGRKKQAQKKTAAKGEAKTVDKPAKAPPEPEGFKEIVADLKARKCRTGKRLRNAIKSYFNKTDETEIDRIIEAMINGGYMLVAADGHVTWIENPA
jgi:hypothetical protein